MKYCPSCGTPNRDTSGFCAKCGTKLPQAPVQAPAQPPNTSAVTPAGFTPPPAAPPNGYPGAQPNGAPNAQQAGNAAAEPPKKKKEKKPKDKKKSKAPWIAGGCVLLAAAGAAAGFFIWKGRQKDSKLTLEEFKFRQSAFECGQGDVSTLVMAVFDSSADTSGLKLTAKCRKTGDQIELTDDGEGADTVAGDNVFYGMVTLSSDEERTLEYSLSVTGGKDVKSESASIRFFTMSSYEKEQDTIRSLRYEIDEVAENYLYQIGSPSEDSADVYLEGAKEIEKQQKAGKRACFNLLKTHVFTNISAR